MNINVLKFGGTSMDDHQSWEKVLKIIKNYEYPVVVVSATARTTRQLLEAANSAAKGDIEAAQEISLVMINRHREIIDAFLNENPHSKNQLIRESCFKKIDEKAGKLEKLLAYTAKQEKLSPQMNDAITSIGEQISAFLLAQCGLALGMLTQHVEARKLIKTDTEYGKANPNMFLINQKCGSLETVLESGFTPVIGGFFGEAPDKTITTLGLEGSDYTASLVGNALNADTVEIWTDVNGIYTSDPEFISEAKPIEYLNYLDATEMAYFGAKVLHPATLKPAQEKNIPVLVKNIFEPEAVGTKISREVDNHNEILALSFKKGMAILTVSAYEMLMGASFLSRVFAVLEQHRLTIDAVQTTEASVTIVLVETPRLQQLSQDFIEIGNVSLERNKGIVSLVGCTITSSKKLSDKVFNAAGDMPVDLICFSKEKRMLSLVLDENHVVEVVQKIHNEVF